MTTPTTDNDPLAMAQTMQQFWAKMDALHPEIRVAAMFLRGLQGQTIVLLFDRQRRRAMPVLVLDIHPDAVAAINALAPGHMFSLPGMVFEDYVRAITTGELPSGYARVEGVAA